MGSKFFLLMWKNAILMKRNIKSFIVDFAVLFGWVSSIIVLNIITASVELKAPLNYEPLALINTTWDGPMTFEWEVFYSPNISIVNRLMDDVSIAMELKRIQPFTNSKEMRNYLIENEENRPLAAVAFDECISPGAHTLPKHLKFDIIFPSESRYLNLFHEKLNLITYNWQTNHFYSPIPISGPRNYESDTGGEPPGYYIEKFVALQSAISLAFVKTSTPAALKLPTIFLQRFPYPKTAFNPGFNTFDSWIPTATTFCFSNLCSSGIKAITEEKEKKLKAMMKMLGLPNWMHWMAWYIQIMIYLTFSMTILVILLEFAGKPGLLSHSQMSAVWFFHFTFVMSLSTLCFMISVIFSKATTADFTYTLMNLSLSFFIYSIRFERLSFGSKMTMCLLNYVGMVFGMKIILRQDLHGEGLRWKTYFSPSIADNDFTVGHATLMLLIDTILYLLIALYVERVFPGDYEEPEKWHFPITKPFNLLFRNSKQVNVTPNSNEGIAIEDYPSDKKVIIQINSLTKSFKDNNVVVDSLSLNIFEGEITVLLGDNGSGKTATMSMLIGLFPPTSGTALVNGHDIRTHMSGVRKSIGICLQHNILFEDLTVREHFKFVGKLKGLWGTKLENEVDKYIDLLHLTGTKDQMTKDLSVGMKRKLCVALALCGDSKLVFLDEPTLGIDLESRREVWDLILNERKERTIVILTNSVDEADILGERIAIMSQGKLKCYGSPFFLKKTIATGYELISEKGPNCDARVVTAFIQSYIPNVKIWSNIGSELSYKVNGSFSIRLKNMLDELENRMDSLDIKGYGVTLTTLEEVFSKVTSVEETDHLDILKELFDYKYLTGWKLVWSQFTAMFYKNIVYSWRKIDILIVQILIPIVLIGLAIYTGKEIVSNNLKRLTIDIDSYTNNPVIIMSNHVKDQSTFVDKFADHYENLIRNSSSKNRNLQKIDSVRDFILGLGGLELSEFNQRYLAGVTVESENITAWFNNQPYHAIPLSLNLVFNALLKEFCANCSIQVTNDPLPFKMNSLVLLVVMSEDLGFEIVMNFVTAMGVVSVLYFKFYVTERITSSKLLQLISGTNVLVYWMSALIVDSLKYLVTIIGALLVLAAFQVENWSNWIQILRIFLLLLLYTWSILPFIYLLSRLTDNPSKGFSIVFFLTYMGIKALVYMFPTYQAIDELFLFEICFWLLRILPHGSLTNGLIGLRITNTIEKQCHKICSITKKSLCSYHERCCSINYFQWATPGIGKELVSLTLSGVLFTALLLLLDFKLLRKMKYKLQKKEVSSEDDSEIDSDVLSETRRVKEMTMEQIKDNSLVMRDITKQYNNFGAVNGLCLAIESGECFGLLGAHGAGKTTTLKMLTGDESLSSGDAWVKGINIKSDLSGVYKHIGYCPQFDALFDQFTGRETLRMLCLIRGVPPTEITALSRNFAVSLNFLEHLDKRTVDYSAGRKKKLSTALALIGKPSVVFLDEPTTGMNLGAKRHLWNVISAYRDLGETIILTTHSVDESEALCTRLAIMVAGEFKCLGSRQHLKNKFTQGYLLTIQLNRKSSPQSNLNNEMSRVKNYISTTVKEATLKDEYQGRLTFIIPLINTRLSTLFGIMEKAKQELTIESYSLKQSSLDKFFHSFPSSEK